MPVLCALGSGGNLSGVPASLRGVRTFSSSGTVATGAGPAARLCSFLLRVRQRALSPESGAHICQGQRDDLTRGRAAVHCFGELHIFDPIGKAGKPNLLLTPNGPHEFLFHSPFVRFPWGNGNL